MFSVTNSQIEVWLGLLLWPFFRILAMLAADPFFSNRAVSIRTRGALALLLTVLIAPMLPPMPAVSPVSPLGILIIIQQVMIGAATGLVMRIMFTGIEMAGHVVGLQMGLGFASFFDPQHGANTEVVAQFFSLMAMLIFLSLNGHLVVIETLAKSFVILPISATPLKLAGLRLLVEAGSEIFMIGLVLSLPVLAALLITNLAMAIMSRAAPQFNLFAVGFAITLSIGMAALYYSLPRFVPQVQMLIDHGARLVERLAKSFL